MSATARVASAWRGGPLASRDFRLLAGGQLTSTIGDFCYAVALPWLVLSAHGGPVLLGAVLACYGVPRTVLIPVGGILADKIGPRVIMLSADVVRCGLVTVLVLLASQRLTSLAVLGPIAALLGAGEGLFLPASFAIMPTLLLPEQLAAGNALSSGMVQVGSLAGPVLGGALVASAGSAPAFAVDAATFAVSALSLALIGLPGRKAAARAAPARAAAGLAAAGPIDARLADARPADTRPADTRPADTGPARPGGNTDAEPGPDPAAATGLWQLLRQSRLLQIIVVLSVAANFAFAGTFEVALPALAHASFGAGGYGALIACLGAGSVAGTLAGARGNRLRRPALVACCGFLGGGTAAALIPFLGGLPGAAVAVMVLGACNGFGNIVMITLLQRWAPTALLGRVMSLIMLAAMGAFPISVALAGVLVRSLGPAPFFPVAGALLAGSVLVALTQGEVRSFGDGSVPSAGDEPATPAGDEPAVSVPAG